MSALGQSELLRRFRVWSRSRRNRSLLAALIVGVVVRLVWSALATTAPIGVADAEEYVRIAVDFSAGKMPTFVTGDHSAYWAAGYPLLLSPFMWFARHSGLVSPLYMASLVNVVAGSITVGATAFLAARWISPAARNPAAWLIALAPAQIYYTSTAHSETVLTMLILVALAAITVVLRRFPPGRDRARWLVGVGVLVGMTVLVKSSGLVLFFVPLLALRADSGRWRGALKATGWLVLGSLVLIVPWTIRNGVQVGVWTPLGTQNATVVCMGNHDTATGGWHPVQESLEDCYQYSPWDDRRLIGSGVGSEPPPWWTFHEPDEPRWYRQASAHGLHWAVTHPVREVQLAWLKTAEAWGDEWDALPSATNFRDTEFAGGKGGPFDVAADLWLWAVQLLAIGGLVFVRACRRALPIWGTALLLTMMIWGGLAQPHYRHPAVPLLVVLAGGSIAALQAGRARGPGADEEAEPVDEPVPA